MDEKYQKVNKVFVTRVVSPGLHDTAMLMPGDDVVIDGFDVDTSKPRMHVKGGRLVELIIPSPGAKAEGFVDGHGWFVIGRLWPADGHREAVREFQDRPIRRLAEAAESLRAQTADAVAATMEAAVSKAKRDWTPDEEQARQLEAWRRAKYQIGDSVPVDELPREDTIPRRGAAEVADGGGWQVRLPFPLLSTVVMDGPPELAGRTDRDSYADGLVVGYEVRAGYELFARVEWWDACDMKDGSFEVSRLQRKTW